MDVVYDSELSDIEDEEIDDSGPKFYIEKDTSSVIMGLLSLPFAFVGAFVSGIVLGVIVDQELKIPRLPHPYDLKDRVIEKMKEYKKDK